MDETELQVFLTGAPKKTMRGSMKKLIILFMMLFIISAPAAGARIEPTWDIGLFISPELFEKALKNTPVYKFVFEQESFPYQGTPSKVAKYVKEYHIRGGACISLFFNKYDKIHGIRVWVHPTYLLQDDCFEMYELVSMVFGCTGLVYTSEYEQAIAMIKAGNGTYTGANFVVKRYVEEIILTVDIMSIYNAYSDPYSLMEHYDTPCDPNYVGGCVPVVNYDLDCTDILAKNFFVVGVDRHKLDGDRNGICCEPYPK